MDTQKILTIIFAIVLSIILICLVVILIKGTIEFFKKD